MILEKPYIDWVIKREFDLSSDDFIGGGLDSDTYLRGNKFGKRYIGDIHPWTIIDYHRIHKTLALMGPQEIRTEIGKFVVQVLDLGPVYRGEDGVFFSLPEYIEGKSLTEKEETKSLNKVRNALGLNKIGTKCLLSHNSKVTEKHGSVRHITITDLGGTIPSFVDANRGLIDATLI